MYKIKLAGFPNFLLRLLDSFLTDRTFTVNVNNQLSSPKNVPAGVPQGAVLSPILFSLFVNDMTIPIEGVELAQFADDVAISNTGRKACIIGSTLQRASDNIQEYCKAWKLELNPEKTEALFFTKRTAERAFPSRDIRVENQLIPWGNSAKYMGVYLDRRLTFKRHIEYVIQKSAICSNMLYPLMSFNSRLRRENKLLLYKAVIRPILLYGSPVWGNCAETHISKLQIIQNKYLKRFLKLPFRFPTRDLHELTGMDYIKQHILKLNSKFLQKLEYSDNPLIRELQNN